MEINFKKKNAVYIGFGFFCILMFWYLYNFYVPLMLEDLLTKRNISNVGVIIGLILAGVNIFAVLVMVLVGKLSDKIKDINKKRMPFIFFGFFIMALILPLVPLLFLWNKLTLFIFITLVSLIIIYIIV